MEHSAQHIDKYCQLYRNGILCPAEHWILVVDELAEVAAAETLNALPPALQNDLRSIYDERPGSIHNLRDLRDARRIIEAWCQSR